MGTALVIIAVGDPKGRSSGSPKPADLRVQIGQLVGQAHKSHFDEVLVVATPANVEHLLPAVDGLTVVVDEARPPTQCSAARAALDYCGRLGSSDVVLALLPIPAVSRDGLERLRAASNGPIVVGEVAGSFSGLVRLDGSIWPLVPLQGPLEALWRSHRELVMTISLDSQGSSPQSDDYSVVARLLGREPSGAFRVVVRDRAGYRS